MANLWGNGKKSESNKTNGYKNGNSAKKQNARSVPVLDREAGQPDGIAESNVPEAQQQTITAIAPVDNSSAIVAESRPQDILKDSRVVKLIDAFMIGKITEIKPSIDISMKSGGHYPDVERLLDTTTTKEATELLEKLAENDILHKKLTEKLHCDPDGSIQLVPVERCPKCGSGNLISGKLIEHFYCGNIGLEQEFKHDIKYICSKCNRELKLLGTDYRYAGTQYKCLDCNDIFPAPLIKWRNLQTDKARPPPAQEVSIKPNP